VRWRLFVTLTFDPRRVYPVRRETADREAFWWCGQMSRLLRRPLGWLYAAEQGRCGQWHAHVLIVGADSGEMTAAIMMWRQRNGELHCQHVTDTVGVTLYASKDAALAGEIVWSDTLTKYRTDVHREEIIALHP
jgi:hypothetical protein